MQIFSDALFDGQRWLNKVLLTVKDGKVFALESEQAPLPGVLQVDLIAPGFIDVQVNGGGGVLFNHDPTLDALKTISATHQRFGTCAMLPTVISDRYECMLACADAVAQALAERVPGIIGIHFEGPHLSIDKKGIHPASAIRELTDREMALFMRKDLGKVVVTLAPENVTPTRIRQMVDNGIMVCLGHSNANAEQTIASIDAGASGFTHLYNAMSAMTSRQPGMVGAALAKDDAYAGLIVDLHHVDKIACQVAIKAKGRSRIMLVTDAMSHVGIDQNELCFNGQTIYRQGNKLSMQDGTLAGSALDMASAVRNTHIILGYALADALVMASATPAAFLGLEDAKGHLQVGADADFVVMTKQHNVTQTFIAGDRVFNASRE